MWLGALAAFLSTRPEDGVNIGAALLAMLAFLLIDPYGESEKSSSASWSSAS